MVNNIQEKLEDFEACRLQCYSTASLPKQQQSALHCQLFPPHPQMLKTPTKCMLFTEPLLLIDYRVLPQVPTVQKICQRPTQNKTNKMEMLVRLQLSEDWDVISRRPCQKKHFNHRLTE